MVCNLEKFMTYRDQNLVSFHCHRSYFNFFSMTQKNLKSHLWPFSVKFEIRFELLSFCWVIFFYTLQLPSYLFKYRINNNWNNEIKMFFDWSHYNQKLNNYCILFHWKYTVFNLYFQGSHFKKTVIGLVSWETYSELKLYVNFKLADYTQTLAWYKWNKEQVDKKFGLQPWVSKK